MKEVKTVTITERGQIALPKNIRAQSGFQEGSKIAILAFDDHIELRPLQELSHRMIPALLSERSLAKQWLRVEEDNAWNDL